MATILHKVLFSWFIVLVFMIFLVLRLDAKVIWNWFIVFIPMWISDLVMLVYVIVHMISHCKHGQNRQRTDLTVMREVWYLSAVILKIIFQTLLCLRLQYFSGMGSYFVAFPVVVLCLVIVVDLTRSLFTKSGGSSFPMQRRSVIRVPPRIN